MPKTIPAALQVHYDTGQTCMAPAVLIQRLDGELFGFTLNSKPLILDITPWNAAPWDLSGDSNTDTSAFEFESASGMEAFVIESSAGFEVDETQIVTLNNGDLFSENDILAGRWRGARFRIFLYRWDVAVPTIADDVETLKVGTIGELHATPVTVKAELHCLKRGLQIPVGIVTQPTCRVRVFSTGDGQCNKDPTGFVHSLTVTGVTDKGEFTCSGAGQAADYFGYGIVQWDTGLNAGLSMQVSTFESGVFTLVAPMIFNIQVGDTLTATAGCRGRFTEDCKTKFNNAVNFQGEKDAPTRDRTISGVGG
jgi:uncharacterized phage protein (TIGR02218 family)